MWRATWSSLVLAVALCGCVRDGGPVTFSATFPAETTLDLAPIAVSFIDQTGLISAMSLAPAGSGGDRVSNEPGDPNALRLDWTGTNCDGRISLVMIETGDAYTVTVHVDHTIVSGFLCPTEQVFRAVTIRLREPVNPARFRIEQAYP